MLYRPRMVALLLLVLFAGPAAALQDMGDAETISELLATPPVPPDERAKELAERRWAILPQVGYGPETGPQGGAKFEHRNLFGLGISLDANGTYALNRQQDFDLDIGTPHLMNDRFLVLFRLGYNLDPQLDFFGLGNNDLGPDAASTNSFEETDGALVVGWRPWRQFALSAGIGLQKVRVGRGDRDDDIPFTIDRFPDMPGIPGGWVNPISLTAVWNTRESVVRPTRGWRIIGVVTHTNEAMISDFQFTRCIGDVSYLHPFLGGKHVLGFRLGGAYVDGPQGEVPYWALEEMGGDDSLRGFFPGRFFGRGRVLGAVEYRARLFAFDFFDFWHVQVDGAVFGDAGRVFIPNSVLRDEYKIDQPDVDSVEDDLRYSYGTGVRFALSQAIIARIDVGFSEEETGLVYLTFGHTF